MSRGDHYLLIRKLEVDTVMSELTGLPRVGQGGGQHSGSHPTPCQHGLQTHAGGMGDVLELFRYNLLPPLGYHQLASAAMEHPWSHAEKWCHAAS